MKRLALLTLALFLAAIAFLWLRVIGTATDAPGMAAPLESRPPAASPAEALAREDRGTASRATVAEAAHTPTSQPAEDREEFAILRGRCVAAENGEPLASMQVYFDGSPRHAGVERLHGKKKWDMPWPFVTGADGRFEFRFPAYSWFQHSFVISGEGRITRGGSFPAFEPRSVTDFGDLTFERGLPVNGFVTDEAGSHVAEATVSLRGIYPNRRLGTEPRSEDGLGFGKSGPDGSFAVTTAVPPGTWRLEAHGPGLEHLSPKSIEVRPEIGCVGVRVVVRRKPSIQGTVTEENGAPAPRLSLSAWSQDGRTLGSDVVKDGRFELFLGRGHEKPEPVRIGWESQWGIDYESFKSETAFEWGARDVRLVAKRLAALELEVVEADTGKPVEEFAVRRRKADDPSFGSPGNPGRSPGGRRKLERLARGEMFVEVVPRRPDLLPSDPVRIVVADGPQAPLRVELKHATAFTVRVLHTDRSPVPGAAVELIDCHELGRATHDAMVLDDRSSFTREDSWNASGRSGILSLVSKAASDAEGRARLLGSPLVPRLALRVLCPEHPPLIVAPFVFPPGNAEIEVLLVRGARLDVTVKPVSVARLDRVGFVLRKSGQPGLVFPDDQTSYAFARDGTAHAAGVPPGSWDVLLFHGNNRYEPPLAVVRLDEGRTARLDLELPHLAPARLEGKVLWKGERCRSGEVSLGARFQGDQAFASARLDTSGSFVAEGLLPGRYQLSARLNTPEGELWATHVELVDLPAGTELSRVFDLRPRTLRLRVLDHEGRPAAGVTGDLSGATYSPGFTTDARGEALVSPVPGVEVRVTIGNRELPERYSIPPEREPELTVRMPAPEKK